ncbi:TMEM175 family protein [Actinomadura macra]|uniref:TMEM175 family protein n=1 Tax=Actinomadura macra TaxID=46164 RepID=UPI00082E0D5C|nr:TMEM175 family protein [Actinomadura macra]
MAISREPDRLVLFTDAVVAIAVTLLVLPLVDVVPEASEAGDSAVEVITKHQSEIWSFLLSFVVIMRLWLAHHRIFQHVRAYSRPLIVCNLGWLLTIIVLPFPTEMAGVYSNERFTPIFYISTILLATGFQLGLMLIVGNDTEVASKSHPVTPEELAGSVTVTALLAAALILVLAIPQLSYWTLLVLFLSSVIEKFWLRRFSHRTPIESGTPARK